MPRTVKPKTLAGYRHDIDHYIVPRIGRMRLQALRPAVISKLYRELAEHGARDGGPLSAWTISHIHRTLRKALADAVHIDQLLAVNPAEQAKRPRHGGVEPTRVWTAEQLDTFLTTARSHRLFAFYRLAAYTGARRGELLYLRWQAVNLDTAEITFGGSTAVVRGQRIEGTTKGGRSRVVSIDVETVAVLREHRRRQAEERLAAGSAWADTGSLVFANRWGEPLYPDTVTALMSKLINQHNKSVPAHRPGCYLMPACTIYAICTRPRCCSLASRSMSWLPGLAMQTRPLLCAFTRMCCANMPSASAMSSPRPWRLLLANPLASPASRLDQVRVFAGQSWWSGAGSNRRPSAFQADAHTN